MSEERGGHQNIHQMTSPRAFPTNMGEMMAPSSSTTSSAVHSLTSASTLDSPTESTRRALRDSVFESATWRETDGESPEELQRKDPLGTQIWKLYSKTKNTLPNSERMENLTWRMMSMNLRRAQHQRYDYLSKLSLSSQTKNKSMLTSHNSRLAHYQQRANAPSGIAQLRQSAEAQSQSQSQSQSHFPAPTHDHMNLDDFIVPSSIASPISQPSPPASLDPATSEFKATPTGIPIRRHQQLQEEAQDDFVARASAPSVAPTAVNKTTDEFGYIQRHVRKTSIDERRVSRSLLEAFLVADFSSHQSDVPTAHPRSLLSLLVCLTMLSSTTIRSTQAPSILLTLTAKYPLAWIHLASTQVPTPTTTIPCYRRLALSRPTSTSRLSVRP